jgi:hypothetical protein
MYRELLQTLCFVLSNDKKASPDLVLVSDLSTMPANGPAAQLEPFTYESMLPENETAHTLPATEAFLEEAEALIRKTSPKVMAAIPPWLPDRELSREWRDAHPRIGLIEAFIEQVFHPPSPNGNGQLLLDQPPDSYRIETPDALILFIPNGLMTMMRTGDWRATCFKRYGTTIIEHDHSLNIPGFGLPLHHQFRATTLVIQKKPSPLHFFKITQDAAYDEQEALLHDLKTLLNKQGGETRYGYVYRGELTPDYPTTFDFYSPATQKLRDSVKDLSQKVSLAEVADVLVGFMPIPPRQREDQPARRDRCISGRNILPNGEFDFTDLRQIPGDREIHRLRYLEKGDICVRRIRNPQGQAFIAAVFPGYRDPLAFDQSIIVIRPKAFLEEEQRLVILAFLRSSIAKDLFIAKGNSIQLSTHVLKEFPVPLADEDLVTAIKGLTEARNAFAEWKAKLDQDLSDIIVNRDLKESRMKILTAGQLARQRYRAARQVEELDYRIRTQYPLPLAYLWRDWQVSSPDHYRSLRNILKAAEGFTCFFSLIALLAGRISNIRIGYIEQMAGRLADRGGGTNFGDWFAILKEVGGSKKFREQKHSVPFFEVTEMMRTEEFETALRLLMKTRNDDSHGRINPNAVAASLLKELETALTLIYNQAGFVSDYGLLQIKRSRLDSIKGITRYEYADLKGDNPLVPMHKGETTQTDLEIDSLYLRDRAGTLHLFRPYLHYLECPECHLMSTFYLDTYPGSGPTVGLKSFERNSTRDEELAEDFKWAGLLKNDA